MYLKTGEMTSSKGFFPEQAIFPQEYLLYFKGKWRGTGQKELLIGRFDSFQMHPYVRARIPGADSHTKLSIL